MKTELLGQEKNIVKIKLDIEASEFTKALNKALNELSQQVNIPGFRKGKTPRKILEMRFGKDAIYNEALEKIMPDQIQQMVEDYDLDPLDSPTLELKEKIIEGQPVVCELTFEVRPEVELPEIEAMEIEKVIEEVNDEAVDKLEKRVRIQLAKVQPADRPVKDEDVVKIELTIRTINSDGTETEEQPKPNPSEERIDLTDTTIRQAVREALIGKSKGDEAEAEFDVEENHSDKALAGKRVRYKMKVLDVAEYVLPEVNEQFFKDVFGPNTDIKDEEAFRARLRKDLESQVADETLNDLRSRAADMVISQSKVELPENLIARQISSIRRENEQWAKDNNVSLNEAYGLDTEEGKKGYENILKTRAETSVKNVLVMDAVAKKFDIHLEKKDLEDEFDRRAKSLNVSKGFVAKYFYENQKQLDRLTDELRWDKIADTIISQMKVKEVKELSKPEATPENQGE